MTATDLKSSRVFEGRGCLLARDDVDEGSRIPRYLCLDSSSRGKEDEGGK